MDPIGDLIGLAVGVHAGPDGPAVFDLLGLRFEQLDEIPLSDVAVRIQVHTSMPAHQWTRRDAEALTDKEGKWQSPPLPADPKSIRIELAHPKYAHEGAASIVHHPSISELTDGDCRLYIRKPITEERDTHEHPQDGPPRRGYDPFKIFRRLS